MYAPKFDKKHRKKASEHIARNVVNTTMKMKTIVRKPLMIKNHQASSQKFRHQTSDEGRRTYRPKRRGNNNKDVDNRPKTLNDKNHQALSQKFGQLL